MQKKPLIVLTGPTAVGKTGLSISLAEKIDAEIISADSMQVYRSMDIGTAKITKSEMKSVKHHLIDILDPSENFNVAIFQEKAIEAIDEIYARNHIPMIVGGTAFYIQALLYGIDFTEEDHDHSFREKLQEISETEEGKILLHNELQKVDPVYANSTHYNNAKRIIRALEYHHYTGKLFSDYNETQRKRTSPYQFYYFVLTDDREVLYKRINERVDLMVQDGLVKEVKQLYDRKLSKNLNSMQGVGYRELFEYFDDNCSLETAIENIKKNTRHFAKRQLTWFRRESDVIWIHVNEFQRNPDKILNFILEQIKEIPCGI